MVIALFVVFSAMLFDQLLNQAMTSLQSQVDINVYFVPDAPDEEIDRIREAVAALSEVEAVQFTTREDALQQYRADNQGNEIALQALEELSENPLGANISVQARETGQYAGVAQFLLEQQESEEVNAPVIDVVNYENNREAIDTLTSFIDVVERVSMIVTAVLLGAALLITFNTIRLGIYTSREEIAIMRLVGASNTFIRGPFMLQGTLYGLFAGIITLAIFYPILIWIGPGAELMFGLNLMDYYLDNFRYIFLVIVGTGVTLGLVSSTYAVTRYLRT
jgi:cell division transport system permease protein